MLNNVICIQYIYGQHRISSHQVYINAWALACIDEEKIHKKKSRSSLENKWNVQRIEKTNCLYYSYVWIWGIQWNEKTHMYKIYQYITWHQEWKVILLIRLKTLCIFFLIPSIAAGCLHSRIWVIRTIKTMIVIIITWHTYSYIYIVYVNIIFCMHTNIYFSSLFFNLFDRLFLFKYWQKWQRVREKEKKRERQNAMMHR